MASETSAPPVNGNYAPFHADHQSNSSINGQSTVSSGPNAEAAGTPSKDEVGWYFVEQYYTTLSKSPEKLHLFYAKRSQFVSGVEAEKVSVSVGQRAIAERIKELDIQDCKVRVSNVDSQESFKNIVVQVIGEMSNKSAPHRKFAQTFVLAEQPNGYFVLNDIFRYIAEDEDDEMDNEIAEMEAHEDILEHEHAATHVNSGDLVAEEKDVEVVDKKLGETASEPKEEPKPDVSTTTESPTPDGDSLISAVEEKPAEITNPEVIAEAVKAAALEAAQPEAPKDPQPSPAPSSPKPAKAVPVAAKEPVAAPKPAAPKTWASLVANRGPSPAVPAITSNNSSTQQPKAAPPPASDAQAVTTAPATEETQGLPSPGGWQTAGQEHHKKQNRQQGGSAPQNTGEKGNVYGYIKNVTERVDPSALRQTLSQFGKLEHFDVNKPKNCAFVEFADNAGYTAAVTANPHNIGGEELYVEERRRNAPFGGFNGRGGRGGMRGGMENRSPSSGGRGGYANKDGGRGGFTPRGRGGNVTPRGGRGMPQAA